LGYWELAKKQNVDAGAIWSCNLGDLLIVGPKIERLKHAFCALGDGQQNILNSLRQLRNRVAHPFDPLFRNLEDVRNLGETLRYAVEMLTRMEDHQPVEKKADKALARRTQ